MKVLVSGSTGLVGSALVAELKSKGHQVVRLVRRPLGSQEQEILWNPAKGELNPADLAGIDTVVHLAGENIAEDRWTADKKRRIKDSRIKGTCLLSETLAKMDNPPKVLISASAIGFYGDRRNEALTETSASGQGFLPEVCRAWEESTQPAKNKGIRVVNLRIGVVWSRRGGAFKTMMPFYTLGAGYLGSGKQHISWITLEDLVGAILHCLSQDGLRGPVNATSPNPVTNAEMTWAIRSRKPLPINWLFLLLPPLSLLTNLPRLAIPALALLPPQVFPFDKGMADELLLADDKVMPVRLTETGYHFKHPTLRDALDQLL